MNSSSQLCIRDYDVDQGTWLACNLVTHTLDPGENTGAGVRGGPGLTGSGCKAAPRLG